MAFDRTKPADTDYISASAANLRENFRALAEDTRLYGTGAPESSAGQNGWRYVDTANGDEYLKVNGAWIKKTDLAALIAALLGEDIYKRSNIIGTVGQSSDVPTGAVIEHGSNTNGQYIKFADGTMICFARELSATNLTLNVWKEYNYTLPAAFYSEPVVSPDLLIGTSWAYVADIQSGGSSANQVTILLVTTNASYTSLNKAVQYIAIGRWF